MRTLLAAFLATLLFAGCAQQILPKSVDMEVHDCHVTMTRSN
jgi:outer membrane murein-binding lipoprotein Lpp